MLRAFIDESYSSSHYYVGSIVIHDDDLPALERALENAMTYAEGFGVVRGTEFHAHKIMTGTKGWEPVKGRARAAIAIYQNALTEIASLPAVLYVRGVDVIRLNARYKYPHPPHRIALQHVLEDVSDYGRSRDEMVAVVADIVENQESHRAHMETYQLVGTPGYKPNKLAHIAKPIEFADSATSAGLQVADLVTYLYRRFDSHVETDPRARASVEAMWGSLRPVVGLVRCWTP